MTVCARTSASFRIADPTNPVAPSNAILIFTSAKLMTTIHSQATRRSARVFTKGAHDVLLARCSADHLHAAFPASGRARKVIEAGGNVAFPAGACTPVNAGSASPTPNARGCPLSWTVLACRSPDPEVRL